MMDLHLSPSAENCRVGGKFGAAYIACQPVPCGGGKPFDSRLKLSGTGAHVGDELGCRAFRPDFDGGRPSAIAARVLSDDPALGCPLEPADHAVGVPGDVGEHVADSPARKLARRTGLLISQAVNRAQKCPVRPPATGDGTGGGSHRLSLRR